MKRDMDLIRAMLLRVEAHPTGYVRQPTQIEGFTAEEIGYHAYLIINAGLAEGPSTTHQKSTSPTAVIALLTWAGHEFLDAAREPKRWGRAKQAIEKLGGASFQIWTQVLTKIMTDDIG